MNNKLFVGNISYEILQDQLEEIFSEHGSVVDAVILNDRDTGRSRGFGFVTMSNDEEAQAAISALDGAELAGRKLAVNVARPREERPRGGGGGGGGGRGGRGGGGGYGGGGGGYGGGGGGRGGRDRY